MPKINLPKYLNWLEKRNLSFQTITVYKWGLQEYGTRELNTENIVNFFKEKLTKYKPKSLMLCRAALVSYAKFEKIVIEWELTTRLIPAVQQRFFSTVNEEELEKLKQIKPRTSSAIANQRNSLIFDFLFWTGIRVKELVNIRHYDYQNKNLRIKGKGNKVRYIPIPPFLEKYFNGSSDHLFKTCHDKRLSEFQVRAMIYRRVCKARLTKHVSPHTFRRTFATLSNKRGIKLNLIQKVLGHSDINITANYIHNSYEEIRQEYSKLWLNSPPPPPQHLFLKSRK